MYIMCVYIYIYNYMHNIYIYAQYIYTHTHTHTYIHTYMHTYIYMYVCDTPQKLKQFLSSHISVFRNCTCFFGKLCDLPQFVDILFMNLEFSRLLMYRYTYQHVISYVYSIHGKIILKNYVCIHRIETMYVYIETMYR